MKAIMLCLVLIYVIGIRRNREVNNIIKNMKDYDNKNKNKNNG